MDRISAFCHSGPHGNGTSDIHFPKSDTLPDSLERPQDPKAAYYSQTHALCAGDINGDGLTDFVTGKRYYAHNGRDPGAEESAVLYWYELKRGDQGAEFIPHLVDSDSGVGCQVAVGDVNGDGNDDIAIGNKKGVFVFRSR